MSKLKKYAHIIIAVGLAAGAGLGVYSYTNANTPSVNVVVTQGKLPVGTLITSDLISTKMVAKSVLPPDAVTRPQDVVGKTLSIPVLGNEILRKEEVIATKNGLDAKLAAFAPGKVAVDLPADAAQGLSGLAEGDKVDIWGQVGDISADGKAATTIGQVAADATVISVPHPNQSQGLGNSTKSQAIVIACDPSEKGKISQMIIGGKKVVVFLQGQGVK